jgi:hypothetical protein
MLVSFFEDRIELDVAVDTNTIFEHDAILKRYREGIMLATFDVSFPV